MTLRVLEFNDAGIRISDDSGVLASSPGYALVVGSRIEFGDSARRQSRLNPLNCYNQFWHKLNLDPFARPVAHYRHNADIAFSHLKDLAAATRLEGDVLLAVPGSFSRQQLAILLGLVRQSPFNAVGIVDASLAAAIDHARNDNMIHADIQLHQVVLTKLERQGSDLVRESVVQVPGTGWVNMSESLIQLLTTAFIQQCRFNPQHNAQSEQMLFDGLPGWLRESDAEVSDSTAATDSDEARRNLLVTISHNNIVHQARIPRSSLATRLQPFFQKVLEQMMLLDPLGSSRLLVSDRLQGLPGLATEVVRHFSRITALPPEEVGNACLRYDAALRSPPEAVHFFTRLRPVEMPADEELHVSMSVAAEEEPTHFLLGNQARKLVDGLKIRLLNGTQEPASLDVVRRDSPGTDDLPVRGEIAFEDGHFSLRTTDAEATEGLLVNGSSVQPVQRLHRGDRIGIAGTHDTIHLIRVHDGE